MAHLSFQKDVAHLKCHLWSTIDIGIKKLFFLSEEKYSFKKEKICVAIEHVRWKKRRTSAWWDKFLKKEVMDSDWLENFWMSKTSFEELVNIMRPYLEKQVAGKRVSNCFFLVLH